MDTRLEDPQQQPDAGHTVLIVDDEPANLGVISSYLGSAGFEVLIARDGESGLEKAQYAQPDLILLDVLMPGIDGFETCRRLKRNAPTRDIPVIFTTALTTTEDKVRGFEAGAVDFVSRPFQLEEVLARVSTHLHLRDLARRLQEAKQDLERRVEERTAELTWANRELQAEIAERRRVEEELRYSEERYRSLFEGVPVGIYRTDPSGQFIDANPALVHMLGYPDRETLLAEDANNIYVNSRDREQWQEIIKREGVVRDFEVQCRQRDGTVIWVKDTGRVVRDDSEQVLYYEGSLEDVTERKRAEEALRHHVERLKILRRIDRAILAAESPEAIAQAALAHVRELVDCRRVSAVVFDRETGEGVILAAHVDGETQIGTGMRLPLETFGDIRALERGEVRIVEAMEMLPQLTTQDRILQAEGVQSYANVPLLVRNQLIGVINVGVGESGALTQQHQEIATEVADQLAIAIQNARLHQAVQRHADELARALEQLQELDLLKTEFIQNVSHELRTPLSIARGYVELLETGELGELQPEQREPVNIAARRLRMLGKLVDDITAILELEARELQGEPVELAPLVHGVLDHFRVIAEQQGLTLEADVASDLPLVRGESSCFYRVLDNLLNNAIKFTPAGGRVAMSLRQSGEQLVLEVTDTGIGIPKEQQERIFERFYQVNGSIRRRYGGVGLGLALVKESVEALGGEIGVESELGQGSTFRVTWPLHR